MEVINIIHKEVTDEEMYQALKRNKNPFFMKADVWKKLRLQQLKKEGLIWSS